MFKKTETKVIRRGRYYFVILRQYRAFFGLRFWQDKWRETYPRFLSRGEAAKLALNIKDYLRGKYNPVSAR